MNNFFNLNSARSVAEATENYPNSPEGRQTKSLDEIAKNTEELQELRRIADSTQQHSKLAMSEAEDAKKAARRSFIFSILSSLIGAGGLVVAIISLVIK